MKKDLKEAYLNMHLLPRNERTALSKELIRTKPEFLKEFTPQWWWFKPCEVNVLIVTDGSLNYSSLFGFGLTEFLKTFNELEATSLINIRYKVTIAHRGSSTPTDSGPVMLNFNFDTSVTLSDFDQVWLFGFNSSPFGSLSTPEINKIEAYMNGGGGLFATGDHGALGSALCGQIPRVKDMRHWADFGSGEVSMVGERRNDTNRPAAGTSTSTLFQNQADDIPQNVAVRTFGGGLPHPLLSISTSIRPSGIIDIMPDHPHEGECTQEKVFSVGNPAQNISTQIIATSFVLGGSTAPGKLPTVPHCFPSISIFDGRPANVGRIVIDSTWHHFVNVNLDGTSGGVGLTDGDFDVVQQYFMNIARWMSRKKTMFCWWRWIWINLLKNSQIIEASLNSPNQKLKEIKLGDLNSIGMLAKEIIANDITPAFAEEFMINMIEFASPSFAKELDSWSPENKNRKQEYVHDWINYDNIVGTAVGAGFIALRDKFSEDLDNNKFTEKSFESMYPTFAEGVKIGIELALKNLNETVASFSKKGILTDKK